MNNNALLDAWSSVQYFLNLLAAEVEQLRGGGDPPWAAFSSGGNFRRGTLYRRIRFLF